MTLTDEEKNLLFGDTSQLVTIHIQGTEYQVPDGLELLRCYQYLDFNIQFENFCWNGNCENCMAVLRRDSSDSEEVLCCQTPAHEGMIVETLPDGVEAPKSQ